MDDTCLRSVPFIPVRGEGSQLWDQQGKEYIDFAGGIAMERAGSCASELREGAEQQASKFWHTRQRLRNEPVPTGKKIDRRRLPIASLCNSGARKPPKRH